MTDSGNFETAREHKDLLEEVSKLDLPISEHAQRILDRLDEQEE